MKKNFTPLLICLIHTVLVVTAIILLNRELTPYLKTLDNYSELKGYITWINDLLGISLFISFAYFILDFAKKNRQSASKAELEEQDIEDTINKE